MQESSTRRIYNIWAYFYDPIVARLVKRRHRLAVRRMGLRLGDRVLDVGIGTGLSLETYPTDIKVVGLDISEGMLRKAQQRAGKHGLSGVSLIRANALEMPFAGGSFDHILISHVVTVVSDPVRLIREIRRVGKLGCRIVIINHFQSGNRVMALIEKVLCPFFQKIGWRSDLSLERLILQTGLNVDFRYKLDVVDFWHTVFITNDSRAAVA